MLHGWPLVLWFVVAWSAAIAVCAAWVAWMAWRQRSGPTANCCVKCDYNLEGNASGVCPECGTIVNRFAPDPGAPLGALRDVAAVVFVAAPYVAGLAWLARRDQVDVLADLLEWRWTLESPLTSLSAFALILAIQFMFLERLVNTGRRVYPVHRAIAWMTIVASTPLVLLLTPLPVSWIAMLVFRFLSWA